MEPATGTAVRSQERSQHRLCRDQGHSPFQLLQLQRLSVRDRGPELSKDGFHPLQRLQRNFQLQRSSTPCGAPGIEPDRDRFVYLVPYSGRFNGYFPILDLGLYYNPKENYGNSNQDQRGVFSSSIIYFLPFGRGQRYANHISRPLYWAIGGWQANIIALVSSGLPTDHSTGALTPGNRPDEIAPIKYPKSISGHWFDPSSFSSNIPTIASPQNGIAVYSRLGTARRNQIYGPGGRTVDFGMQKNLHLTDRVTLEVHGDAFNVFNTPQFTPPNGSMSNSGTFGKVLGIQEYTNRQIQLAARLTF